MNIGIRKLVCNCLLIWQERTARSIIQSTSVRPHDLCHWQL